MLSNKSLNLFVVLGEHENASNISSIRTKLAIVGVPSVLNRYIELPTKTAQRRFVLIEDVISFFIKSLFNGFNVDSVTAFRITRNFDLTVDEEDTEDKELENAGCHVIYGINHLKTHSKIALVVRQKKDHIERFVHLGTGNYNDSTPKTYSDMGLITSDEKFGIDATNYFNYLSGHMVKPEYHHLIVSPSDIRDEYVELVDKEISYHQQFGDGHILQK